MGLLDELKIVKRYVYTILENQKVMGVDEILFYTSVENLVNEYEKLESRNKANEELIEKLINFIKG